MSKLEVLAVEIESVYKGYDEKGTKYSPESRNLLLSHVRDDNYSKDNLAKELVENGLSFFAAKVINNYYGQLVKNEE